MRDYADKSYLAPRKAPAPILSPSFVWIPSDTHGDVTAFVKRQRDRIREAQGDVAAKWGQR